ncbi:hypothetical protein [Streptomyces adelaidensis]|uniref:hypothetical protein n=1 Tax=Streptomyces adelaidensis TaxID=2796465 RepID=UPI0019060A46|nr:hypothetical protein [Streptomyces adelaidensis]
MTELPYTDDDLRTEAASQHKALTEDPDYTGIGEAMDDDIVPSTEPGGGKTWATLLLDDAAFDEARDQISDLISKAADVSRWAVGLGADGLQPSDEHVITIGADDKPIARIHFAFEPGMPEEMRTALVQGIGQAIDAHL